MLDMEIQKVAVHEGQTVEIVYRKYADVDVYYDKKTGDGTIFWQDIEIECRVTGALMLMLCRLNKCDFLEKIRILQEIERINKTIQVLAH